MLSFFRDTFIDENLYLENSKSVQIRIPTQKLGISVDNGKGYSALANINEHGGQEVPHLHFHLFGGEKISKMVS